MSSSPQGDNLPCPNIPAITQHALHSVGRGVAQMLSA